MLFIINSEHFVSAQLRSTTESLTWWSYTHALNWQHSTAWWTMHQETLRWENICRNTDKHSADTFQTSVALLRVVWAVVCLCQVWCIENLELAEIDPKTYGQFYGGDCYLVLYSYKRAGQQQYILYMWQVSVKPIYASLFSISSCFWKTDKHLQCVNVFSLLLQGRHATSDEIAASAFQAVNIDNKYNGAPVQVRVVMGKEPRHFLAIFKGKLIIFEVWFYDFHTEKDS